MSTRFGLDSEVRKFLHVEYDPRGKYVEENAETNFDIYSPVNNGAMGQLWAVEPITWKTADSTQTGCQLMDGQRYFYDSIEISLQFTSYSSNMSLPFVVSGDTQNAVGTQLHSNVSTCPVVRCVLLRFFGPLPHHYLHVEAPIPAGVHSGGFKSEVLFDEYVAIGFGQSVPFKRFVTLNRWVTRSTNNASKYLVGIGSGYEYMPKLVCWNTGEVDEDDELVPAEIGFTECVVYNSVDYDSSTYLYSFGFPQQEDSYFCTTQRASFHANTERVVFLMLTNSYMFGDSTFTVQGFVESVCHDPFKSQL